MDNLPCEVFNLIISNLNNQNPALLYKLRIINKNFKNSIDNIKNINLKNINKLQYENIFNKLAYDGLYINFEWLFNNNINLSINNINNLIIHNRTDIFNLLLKYDDLKHLLFNQFNFLTFKNELDILSLSKSDNPLIISGINFNNKYSNLDIINILLNDKIKNNPFINQIPGLFEICIKHNNIIVIKYLVTYYYDKIKHLIHKLNNLLLNCSKNIEDIFYYLIQNKKFIVNEQFLINCIKKNYNDLFIYTIKEINIYNINIIINNIIKYNNIDIFKFILYHIKDIDFSYIINNLIGYDYNMLKFQFVSVLLDQYIDKINKKDLFIKLCIINKIENDVILHLINTDFKITIEDIKIALENENIYLVEHLSKKFNNI